MELYTANKSAFAIQNLKTMVLLKKKHFTMRSTAQLALLIAIIFRGVLSFENRELNRFDRQIR